MIFEENVVESSPLNFAPFAEVVLRRGCEKIRFLRPQVFGVLRFFAAFTPTTYLYFLIAQAHKTPLPIHVDVFCELGR